jgi:anti-sigma factor RsiW
MINCSEAVEKLWDYVENDLDRSNQDWLEEHLAFCRRCCGEVEFTQELRTLMRSAAKPQLPREVAEHLGKFLDGLGPGLEPSS